MKERSKHTLRQKSGYPGRMDKNMSQAIRQEALAKLRRRYETAGLEHKRKLIDQAVQLLGYYRKAALAEADLTSCGLYLWAVEPWRDPHVWAMIASGNARAVHHIESPAMTSLCRMSNVREPLRMSQGCTATNTFRLPEKLNIAWPAPAISRSQSGLMDVLISIRAPPASSTTKPDRLLSSLFCAGSTIASSNRTAWARPGGLVRR